jgi:hypothetical protein
VKPVKIGGGHLFIDAGPCCTWQPIQAPTVLVGPGVMEARLVQLRRRSTSINNDSSASALVLLQTVTFY